MHGLAMLQRRHRITGVSIFLTRRWQNTCSTMITTTIVQSPGLIQISHHSQSHTTKAQITWEDCPAFAAWFCVLVGLLDAKMHSLSTCCVPTCPTLRFARMFGGGMGGGGRGFPGGGFEFSFGGGGGGGHHGGSRGGGNCDCPRCQANNHYGYSRAPREEDPEKKRMREAAEKKVCG